MPKAFVEVVIQSADLSKSSIEGRDEIEEPLEAALEQAGLGEVSGGGGGSGVVILDIDIADDGRFDEALATIRDVLQRIGVPRSTIVKRYKPTATTYPVY